MPILRVFVQENPERLHHLKGIYTYRLNKDIDKKKQAKKHLKMMNLWQYPNSNYVLQSLWDTLYTVKSARKNDLCSGREIWKSKINIDPMITGPQPLIK